MSKHNIQDRLAMPEFPIDSYIENNVEVMGIKRVYDIALAIDDSIMQWGAPGVGKSQGVKQWNAEKVKEVQAAIDAGKSIKPWNPVVIDIRLAMKEPVDMVGVPIPVKGENGEVQTVWAVPSVWPKDDGEFSGGVIHLDEMNQAQPAILNAAFQLIQDRALGEYKVPDGYLIIGSSNPPAYNSTVSEFSLPLSNRFSHFNIKSDFDGWLNHRLKNGGNVDVLSYLKTQGQELLFDKEGFEKKIGSLKDAMYTDIVVTPRSWEVIEKLLALPEGTKASGGFTLIEKQMYATGRLGIIIASKLFSYIKDKDKYQSWEEILVKGKDFKSESADQYWTTQIACMSKLFNTEDDLKCREYLLNFIKATKNLKNASLKVINISQIIQSSRFSSNLSLFNPAVDAKELVMLAASSLHV